MDDFPKMECCNCHRIKSSDTMIHVSSPDVEDEWLCDWECFKVYYDQAML